MINFTSKQTIIEIPSDIKIEIKEIKDIKGTIIDKLKTPFYFEFYNNSNIKYVISYDGVNRINNVIDVDRLYFIFDKYKWDKGGVLRYRQLDIFPDENFTDKTRDTWTSGITNITLREWK
ncbi:MAG: hypothetical protein RR513_06455 [Muribaculaceae bacterium]